MIPPAEPIARTFEYQPKSNFLQAIKTGGRRIESPEPHRDKRKPVWRRKAVNFGARSTFKVETYLDLLPED